jgi:hypothetical protein
MLLHNDPVAKSSSGHRIPPFMRKSPPRQREREYLERTRVQLHEELQIERRWLEEILSRDLEVTVEDKRSFSDTIRSLAHQLELANLKMEIQTGACIISLPDDPSTHCAKLTKEQCKDVGGIFVDGDCPGSSDY